MKLKEFIKKYIDIIALFFWCGMIFGFSSVPSLQTGLEEDFLLRKVAHAMEYAILAYLFYVVFSKRIVKRISVFVSSGLATLTYALTDEIHQTYVVGRSGNFFDIGVDACGIGITLVFIGIGFIKRK